MEQKIKGLFNRRQQKPSPLSLSKYKASSSSKITKKASPTKPRSQFRSFRGSPNGAQQPHQDFPPELLNDKNLFGPTNAAMAMLDADITIIGSTISNLLAAQLQHGDYSSYQLLLENEISRLPWRSPNESPTAMLDLKSPNLMSPSLSPGLKRKLSEARRLGEREFEELVKTNREFGNRMRDLRGLREWWLSNRDEWVENRNVVLELESKMRALVTQMGWGIMHLDEFEAKKDQFLMQGEVLKDHLKWFSANWRLMQRVRKRFFEIRGVLEDLKEGVGVGAERRMWRSPEGFKFELSEEIAKDVRNASFWGEGDGTEGYFWWLGCMEGFCIWGVKNFDERIREVDAIDVEIGVALEVNLQTKDAVRRDANARRSVLRLKGEELVNEYEAYRESGSEFVGAAEVYEQEIVVLETQLEKLQRQMENEIRTLDDEVPVLAERGENAKFQGMCFGMRREMAGTLQVLLNRMRTKNSKDKVTVDKSRSTVRRFFRDVYLICCYYGLGEETFRSLEKIYENEVLETEDREKIRTYVSSHMEATAPVQAELIDMLKKTVVWQHAGRIGKTQLFQAGDLTDAEDMARHLHLNLVHVWEEAQKILSTRQELAEKEFDTNELITPELSAALEKGAGFDPKDFSSPASPVEDTVGRPIHGIQEAINILIDEAPRVGDRAPPDPGGDIYAFFTSPDISVKFRNIRGCSRKGFTRLVNSYLKYRLSPTVVDAFLLYCTWVGELFRFDRSGLVMAEKESGWELTDEMGIAGLERKVSWRIPRGVWDASKWLVVMRKPIRDFHGKGTGRLIKEDRLWVAVMKSQGACDAKAWGKYVDFWNETGQFFRIVQPPRPSQQPNVTLPNRQLHRIDNGWKIPLKAPFDKIDYQPYFDFLDRKIRLEGNQNVIIQAYKEKDVYYLEDLYETCLRDLPIPINDHNLAFPAKNNGVFKITFHKFWLYTRWVTQMRTTLTLKRNGEILIPLKPPEHGTEYRYDQKPIAALNDVC